MVIPVKTQGGGYDITLVRGGLSKAGEIFDLNRKVLIVTDSGVPAEYSEKLSAQCKEPFAVTLPQGEENKSSDSFLKLLGALTENGFTRTDCVLACGGGVVGDLAGFAAACYMRGIDFYNCPTTVLSQVDSSIGGKTAIDFMGYKNIIGAFWQPKGVLIDADTLKTLPERQISNGLSEALKMAATSDAGLFEIFEREDPVERIDVVIEKALLIKRSVVQEDERESGLRRVLNFGHTLAHAYETANGLSELYHGECVALGMLPMCGERVRVRLLPILEKLGLPTRVQADTQTLIDAVRHDKKASGDEITVVFVPEVGTFEMKKIKLDDIKGLIERGVMA